MKSKLENNGLSKKIVFYPCIGIGNNDEDGVIVLFTAVRAGTVIHGTSKRSLGHYSSLWHMDDFEYLDSKIDVVLKND